MAEILLRQSGDLGRLVDDLLDVSRINRGGIRLEQKTCDLRLCAEYATEQIRAQAIARNRQLVVELPDAPVVLSGDAVRLAQAIVNLLRNAGACSPPAFDHRRAERGRGDRDLRGGSLLGPVRNHSDSENDDIQDVLDLSAQGHGEIAEPRQ
jgi:nitrogen fixation/metabolism regulation signal transduction histidine kinase